MITKISNIVTGHDLMQPNGPDTALPFTPDHAMAARIRAGLQARRDALNKADQKDEPEEELPGVRFVLDDEETL